MAVVNLAAVQDLLAEKQAWGGPDWTVLATGTNVATVAVIAGNTATTGVKVQHYLDYLTVSAAPAITAATTVQIKDGTTVIWEFQWALTAPTVNHFDFSRRPLRNTAGALLSAGTSSTVGTSVAIDIMMVGHSNVQATAA